MHFPARRAFVVAVALVMTVAIAGPAVAAPAIRRGPAATRPNPAVIIRGSGWGHGIGMSQYGAYAQAQAGWGYRRILRHYYTGIGVERHPMPSKIRVGLDLPYPYSNVDAVSGRVPWRAKVDGQWRTRWQERGTTWNVTLNTGGRFVLKEGDTVKWRVPTDRLLADFNWSARGDGTRIEAYNPNYHRGRDGSYGNRSEYKWGRLEFTPRNTSSGSMYLVLEVPSMELYLRGLAEMPASWGTAASGGLAALKAQAVGGRSYAKHYHAQGNKSYCRCHIRATPINQHFIGFDHEAEAGPWVQAVHDTAGVLATYNGTPIEAVYSSSHGGRSENVEDVWYTPLPYLRSVADPWSLSTVNPFTSWSGSAANGSFAGFVGGGLTAVRRVQVVGRTAGGTPRSLRVAGITATGSARTVTRSNTRNVVGLDLKTAFGLRSAQVRRIGFAPFLDDDGRKYEFSSLFVNSAGIMPGRTATTFAPKRAVTRAAAAQYLYRTLRLPRPTRDYYTDDNHRSAEVEEAINALAEAGISGGLRRGLFRPGDALTRGEAATFFFRALDPVKASGDYYTDDNDSKHEVAINALTRKRLITGCTLTRFCPDRPMRRGPMAALLHATVTEYR